MGAPRVSIVISAFHSDATIGACLESLRAQTFGDFETIVVNSSPEDRTRRIVQRLPGVRFEQSDVRLLPHAARNVGVKHARGALLVFLDPDCVARPDWLERLVRAVEDGHALVCGAMDLRECGWFARAVHLCKYSFRLSSLPGGHCGVAGTANACCTRDVWNAAGPFDGDRYAGDAVFSWRAAAAGWAPWFEPAAIVEHVYTGSVASLWRERLDRGRDYGETRARYERRGRAWAAARLLAMPALLAVVIARTARDALACGWAWTFVTTLPLQLLGHGAWLMGEARAYAHQAIVGPPLPE